MFCPDLTFRPRMSVLSAEQMEQIHQATLELLERTGVQMTHPRGLELLHGAGAHVDGSRVRIPSWMVEDAIRKAPSRVVLANRGGERKVYLEGDKYWFGPSLDCIDYLDPLTDQRRRFTSDDCRVTATLADALPNYTWVMTIGMADDVPADIADRVIAKQVFTYTEKPLVFCCKDVNSVRDIYEMAAVIAGGESQFRQAPTIVHYSEPISPLLYYDPAVEKILYCAEQGIPLINFPAPQGGSTAPATLAGEIVQGSAESLSGLVLAQLARPGRALHLRRVRDQDGHAHHDLLLRRAGVQRDGRRDGADGPALPPPVLRHGRLHRRQVPRRPGRGGGGVLLPGLGGRRRQPDPRRRQLAGPRFAGLAGVHGAGERDPLHGQPVHGRGAGE